MPSPRSTSAPAPGGAPEPGEAAPTAAPAPLAAERLASCFTTSGSSGYPKLAGHDQAAVVRHSANVAAALEMRRGDVFLGVLPFTGVFGFSPAMAMLAAGGACLLEPVFDVSRVIADMQEAGVSHVVGGDDMLARLMDAWDPGTMRATVRRGGIADFGGRSREFVAWAAREWGANLVGVYGSSEIFALTALWPDSAAPEDRVRGGGRTVSPAIGVRVRDPREGGPLPRGEVGELQFRGYNVLDRYLGTPELLAETTTADGWFRSGDLGRLTGEREFEYVCRDSDALRLRGFLVEPAEIERFLADHPAVATAKVVGAVERRQRRRGRLRHTGTRVAGRRGGADRALPQLVWRRSRSPPACRFWPASR